MSGYLTFEGGHLRGVNDVRVNSRPNTPTASPDRSPP